LEGDLFDLTVDTMTRALTQRVTHKPWLESWQQKVKALQQAKAEYHRALQTLVNDPDLTELGKSKRKAELQATFAARIAAESSHLAGYDQHLAQLHRSGPRVESPSDLQQVLSYLRSQEIRQEIRQVDPVILRGDYESRVQDPTGRYDVWLQAVEESPTPLLPGEVLDQGKATRALRSLTPEVRQQIADVTELRNAHQHFVTLVERELPQIDDPLARQAAGEPHETQNG
jgi:hypothetical protein